MEGPPRRPATALPAARRGVRRARALARSVRAHVAGRGSMHSKTSQQEGGERCPTRRRGIQTDERGRHGARLQRVQPHDPDQNLGGAHGGAPSSGTGTPRRSSSSGGGGPRPATFPLAGTEMPDGEVLAYDPPRVFAYTWGQDGAALGGGERGAAGLPARPHPHLRRPPQGRARRRRLGALPAGALREPRRPAAQPSRAPMEVSRRDEPQLNRAYEQRFGIAPEEATPPPR